MLSGSTALAQETTVTGIVTSAEDNSVLPGVSVQVKGTQRGTQSDVAGRYTISTSPNSVLVFSFVGLVPQEIAVRLTFNWQLTPAH